MNALTQKIDFAVIITAQDANPNGDPLNGNRPRENFDGFGEITDVCLKRKIRNRLQDMGEKIFVQSDDRCDDGCDSLRARADANEKLKKISKGKNTNRDEFAKAACEEWIDVRSFGQVFAFKGDTVSVGVRGPVTISMAKSASPVDIVSTQITKSVNSESGSAGKTSDTMGLKHRVEFGLYVAKGSNEENTLQALEEGSQILLSSLKEGKAESEIEEALVALSQKLGIKINGVFQPIRVAITNSTVSLPLFDSIRLLGLEETEKRLGRAISFFKEN